MVGDHGEGDPDGGQPEVEEEGEDAGGWERNPIQGGHDGLGAILLRDHAHRMLRPLLEPQWLRMDFT